jgi:hypothetical protein
MFSAEPGKQDVIKSSPLNATKITSLAVVLITAVTAAWKPVTGNNGPLSDLSPGEKLGLWLGIAAFVTVLVVVDMIVRGHATGQISGAAESAPIVWFNPSRHAVAPAAGGDPGGTVVAMRPSTVDASGVQYLVIRDSQPGDPSPDVRQTAWVGGSLLALQ